MSHELRALASIIGYTELIRTALWRAQRYSVTG
jgi:hypothetical protein